MNTALNAMLEQGNQLRASKLVPVLKTLADKSVSPDMTEAEQMEARKNLGLYYEETSVGEKTAKYNGEFASFDNWAKISDDTPAKDDIIGVLSEDNPPVLIELTSTNYADTGFGYILGLNPDGGNLTLWFYVILEGSMTNTPGIYADVRYATGMGVSGLVYRAQATTVSKIDAKFLPEQESGIEPVTLLQVPTQDVVNAVISDYISDEDWNKLINGKTCVAKYYNSQGNAYQYFLVSSISSTIGIRSTATILFKGINTTFAIAQLGNAYQITIKAINGVYNISALPSNGMSSAELEAIGFKNQDLPKFGDDVKQIRCTNTNGTETATIISVYSFSMTYNVEFWTKDNKYILSGNLMGSDLSCIVTPRE